MLQCPRCKGGGMVNEESEDKATGARLRKLREDKGASLRSVASKMKVSPTYVSFLEKGVQHWNPDLEKRYLDAIGEG